jgi:hypothetical protein
VVDQLQNKKDETAVHLKAVKLKDGNILLLWEKMAAEGYSQNYISTHAMKIDKNGQKIGSEVDLGPHVRLTRRDEPLLLDNKVVVAGGNKAEKKLELIVLDVK